MIGGDPALAALARFKLRGSVRKGLRRLKTPSGLFFVLLGSAIGGLWLVAVYFSGRETGPGLGGPDELRSMLRVGMAFFTVVSLSSAASVKGLYLPKNELEPLFAAPLRRSDLVRYRMKSDALRTIPGAVIFGLLVGRRAPSLAFGMAGTYVALTSLVALRQLVSLLLVAASERFGRLFRPGIVKVVAIAGGLGIWILVMTLVMGEEFLSGMIDVDDPRGAVEAFFGHPVVGALTAPFYPQASMIAAETVGAFALWAGVSLTVLVLLYESAARLPIDFREASLETSETIAKKLATVRKGGVFGGSVVDAKAADRRVPWLFGRSPYGAVAWVKTTEILRRGRRMLFTGVFVVGLVAVVITTATKSDPAAARVVAPGLIALLAVLYLSGGLRVDFRGELDRMERIKGWPLGPARLFAAMIVPQVATVSFFVALAIVARAALLDLWHPAIGPVVIVLPFAAFAWTAVDNLVFLFKPVRFVPGQEGTLHHFGRGMILLLLRLVLFSVVLGLVGVFGLGAAWIAEELLDWGSTARLYSIVFVAVPIFLAADAMLSALGGFVLQRFDVSREL